VRSAEAIAPWSANPSRGQASEPAARCACGLRSSGAAVAELYVGDSYVAEVIVRSVAGQMTKGLADDLLAFRA
jgi:hypothetical protein